jgi:hypothetical protein
MWVRRALFQVHLWSGVILGLYIFLMSATGGVLVYANELYRAATPDPIISHETGPRLTDEQLTAAAARLYPGYRVMNVGRAPNPDQAVDVSLKHGDEIKRRLFDPRSGQDLGNTIPAKILYVSKLIDLHDNLLAGPKGRKINGIGAFALFLVAITGFVIWWPGAKTWRRSLTLPKGVGWRRTNWHLHSMLGFWTFAFTIVFAISGAYLCFPEQVQDFAERFEAPATPATAGLRFWDRVIYWLAFLHFGRIQGIGIPCHGPVGAVRDCSRGDVRHRGDHVVEQGAAPQAGKFAADGVGSGDGVLVRLLRSVLQQRANFGQSLRTGAGRAAGSRAAATTRRLPIASACGTTPRNSTSCTARWSRASAPARRRAEEIDRLLAVRIDDVRIRALVE